MYTQCKMVCLYLYIEYSLCIYLHIEYGMCMKLYMHIHIYICETVEIYVCICLSERIWEKRRIDIYRSVAVSCCISVFYNSLFAIKVKIMLILCSNFWPFRHFSIIQSGTWRVSIIHATPVFWDNPCQVITSKELLKRIYIYIYIK